MEGLVSLHNDYLVELSAIGWGNILVPERIKCDTSFVESRTILKQAKEIVKKYRLETNTLINNAKTKILNLNVSQSLRHVMEDEFDIGITESKNQIDAQWDLEEKSLLEFEQIITLLSSKRNSWVVENGQILFYNDDDLTRFNTYIKNIQYIVNKQQEIKKQNADTITANFGKIKEQLK